MSKHIDDMSDPPEHRRWHIADKLEKRLNDMFPRLYCNVQPDDVLGLGYFVVRAAIRDDHNNPRGGYVFESIEEIYRFPTVYLRARLWLISPE